MKAEFIELKEYDIKFIRVNADVENWGESELNGLADKKGQIPCRIEESWCPMINVDEGRIVNWEKGCVARISYRVGDGCACALLLADGKEVLTYEDYVPSILCPKEDYDGDYISMDIDADGYISKWRKEELQNIVDATYVISKENLKELMHYLPQ